MRIKQLLALIFITFLLFACNQQKIQTKPEWLTDPGDGAVGSCKTHVKGRHYQEELAVARARERLAARYGVEVSSVQTIKEKIVNDKAYVRSDKEILQTVNKTIVKAHVRETWIDKQYDEVWVWVYPVSN
ncbi:MAG: hypothetical protein OQK98_02180 [Gammaproteobacteria bacterium]|nr:hypothetical protein [Gammaproteobacteria bacterium]